MGAAVVPIAGALIGAGATYYASRQQAEAAEQAQRQQQAYLAQQAQYQAEQARLQDETNKLSLEYQAQQKASEQCLRCRKVERTAAGRCGGGASCRSRQRGHLKPTEGADEAACRGPDLRRGSLDGHG